MEDKTWNKIIASFPEPHILQTWEWGQVKSRHGWVPIYQTWGDDRQPDAAALILQRTINLGGFGTQLRVLYTPKGPILRDWGDQELIGRVLGDLKEIGRQQGAIFIKIDPDVPLGIGVPETEEARGNPLGATALHCLHGSGWQYSKEQIQFRNTVLLDLMPSEDELLASMKQKTRYNIRLADRKGVRIRIGSTADWDMLYRMYAETSVRDGFVIREQEYYETVWRIFMNKTSQLPVQKDVPICEPLIAEVEGKPVAAIVLFRFAGKAYYMHGMSGLPHRNLMPNYLLQWEAIRRAKSFGCEVYDLWGAPEVFDETDSMWGVFRFKQGLGGEVFRSIGAYDLPVQALFYQLYVRILPRILNIMRGNRMSRTQGISMNS